MTSNKENGNIKITSSVKIINLNTGKIVVDPNKPVLSRKLITKGKK